MVESFDRSALPPARVFYEQELGGPLRSAGRDRATASCPFHKSKSGRSFSIDLAKGLWYCHGCGFGGDIVKFVMRRDGCDFKTAAKSLGCWRDVAGKVQPRRPGPLVRYLVMDFVIDGVAYRAEVEDEPKNETERRRQRLRLRDELHTTVQLYRQIAGELHKLGPDAEDHWAVLASLLDDWRLTESDYCRAAGLENQ